MKIVFISDKAHPDEIVDELACGEEWVRKGYREMSPVYTLGPYRPRPKRDIHIVIENGNKEIIKVALNKGWSILKENEAATFLHDNEIYKDYWERHYCNEDAK